MIASYFSINLSLAKKPGISTISLFIAAAINLCLNFILIPPFGIMGAAVAVCLSFGTQMVIEIGFGRKYVPLEALMDIFRESHNRVRAMVVAVIYTINPVNIFTLLITAGIGALIYFGTTVAIKAVNSDELEVIFEILHLKPLERYSIIRASLI